MIVRTLLVVLLAAPVVLVADDDPLRVAVYQGAGTGRSATKLLTAIESGETPVRIRRISPEEIRTGELAEVDVLVHPGGSGGGQGRALGEEGRAAVRKFVNDGGGYLGICAGAYLATNDYEWSLDLIDAKVVDRKHWARGTGTVTLRLSQRGATFFADDDREMTVHYGQGPLLARREWDDPDVPDYESLAIYDSEIAKKGAPQGVMVGTSAAVRSEYGRGRVFCFSPHPELTEGREHLIPIVVRWLGRRGSDEGEASAADDLNER